MILNFLPATYWADAGETPLISLPVLVLDLNPCDDRRLITSPKLSSLNFDQRCADPLHLCNNSNAYFYELNFLIYNFPPLALFVI